ncbi:MAG: DUF1801 domain-containing protein [Lewinellaceae bacterium]|nr:DUF1801 domain-containing protein [Lewinellaceae bacterium]
MTTNTPSSIPDYIASYPNETREILEQIRATIQKAAPDAIEAIKYAIPTFVLNGKNLVHFAAFKSHPRRSPPKTGAFLRLQRALSQGSA